MTFIHKFSRTVSCRCEIADEPEQDIHDRLMVWTGQPKAKHVAEYLRWQHCINEQLSASMGKTLLLVYRIEKNKWQHWLYAPGQPPKLVTTSDAGPSEPFVDCGHIGFFDTEEED